MKKQLLVMMVLAVLTLAACSGSKDTSNARGFIGGSLGVVSTFVAGEPPTEVTSKDFPFSATLKLENKGEWAVPRNKITVTLKGFDAADFGTNQGALTQNPDTDLDKNSINPDNGQVIESSPVYVTFPLKYTGNLVANNMFTIAADVCYGYGTQATAELCIKKDILDTKNTQICTVTGPKTTKVSGGPVQITDFQEVTSGKNAVRFFFTVQRPSTGYVVRKDTQCNSQETDKRIVHLKVDTGIPGLTCSSLRDGTEGDIKLPDVGDSSGKLVQCVQQLSDSDKVDKIKLVNIELTYDYKDYVETQLLVKQVT